MKYIILSEKRWNQTLSVKLNSIFKNDNFILISKKEDFILEKIREINPNKIFIPHWSYHIPIEIYNNFECVIFHMTDLPFGRGGSPLQNLILLGKEKTKLSALRVIEEFDAGDIYLKKDLTLCGTAEEIFYRANKLIEQMITEIIKKNISPKKQSGEITFFKRRKPSESDISEVKTIEEIFDYIRMLDAEGYPHAFIESKYFKFEFSRAFLKNNNNIIANVRIIKK